MTQTVGLPYPLLLYGYGGMWKRLLEEMGCRVLVSRPTSRETLDRGVRLCGTECCLPVKVFTGHAAALAEQTDMLFIPRCITTGPHDIACPEFCALPDVVRMNLRGSVRVLTADVDFAHGMKRTASGLTELARTLGCGKRRADAALTRALRESRREMEAAREWTADRAIAVLGHPYVVGDGTISMGLTDKIKAAGYAAVTPRELSRTQREQSMPPLYRDRNFYGAGRETLGGAAAFLAEPRVRGMIYVTPFACGVDSLAAEFVEHRLRRAQMPFLRLTVDEQTGEAGFRTRLEAFLDMLEERSPCRRGDGR